MLEIEMQPEEERRLTQEAQQQGLSLPDYARRQLFHNVAPAPPSPIWKRAAAIGATIPADQRAKRPHDDSVNYEHYLYQAPPQTGVEAE